MSRKWSAFWCSGTIFELQMPWLQCRMLGMKCPALKCSRVDLLLFRIRSCSYIRSHICSWRSGRLKDNVIWTINYRQKPRDKKGMLIYIAWYLTRMLYSERTNKIVLITLEQRGNIHFIRWKRFGTVCCRRLKRIAIKRKRLKFESKWNSWFSFWFTE